MHCRFAFFKRKPVAGGAVTFVSSAGATKTSGGPSVTQSFTLSSVTNGYLVVLINLRTSLDASPITDVTWNGVAMDFLGTTSPDVVNFTDGAWVYGLKAPDSGTHNVVASFDPDDTFSMRINAILCSGVNQTTSVGTVFTAIGNSTTASVNVTGTNANGLVFEASEYGAGLVDPGETSPTYTAGAGQTQRDSASYGSAPSFTRATMGTSSEPGNGGTVTMSSTLGSSDDWGIIAFELKPV